MQSGISVSKELHSAFNDLVSSQSKRGIIAVISKESVVPQESIPASSTDFLEDLSSIESHLSPTQPAYIILRKYPHVGDGFIAITYIPNAAPVRQKMLFASTRLTLVRELGTERFREQVFVTEQNELTKEGWKKHDAHTALKAPLTQEEESLQGVRQAEAEARGGKEGRQLETGGKLTMPITDEARVALKDLKNGRPGSLVQLVSVKYSVRDCTININKDIDTGSEKIRLADTSTTDAENLATAISAIGPRYSFFIYPHSVGGVQDSSLIFIYTCPPDSKVKERMLYAASKRALMTGAESDIGLQITKKVGLRKEIAP